VLVSFPWEGKRWLLGLAAIGGVEDGKPRGAWGCGYLGGYRLRAGSERGTGTGRGADMAQVLVTGGTGYIACHCMLRLLADGHSIRTTVRSLAREGEVRA